MGIRKSGMSSNLCLREWLLFLWSHGGKHRTERRGTNGWRTIQLPMHHATWAGRSECVKWRQRQEQVHGLEEFAIVWTLVINQNVTPRSNWTSSSEGCCMASLNLFDKVGERMCSWGHRRLTTYQPHTEEGVLAMGTGPLLFSVNTSWFLRCWGMSPWRIKERDYV